MLHNRSQIFKFFETLNIRIILTGLSKYKVTPKKYSKEPVHFH